MIYYVNFDNKSDRTWSMAVYQTFPESVGLDSVAWKLTTVPTMGYSGVQWVETYNVALANYRQNNPQGVYIANQVLPADLGTEWEIVYQENVQQLKYKGQLGGDLGDHILIRNVSGLEANPGVGMDGSGSVYKPNVLSNANAQFKVTPTYWVGLFRDVQLGQVISSDVEVGPLMIKFESGSNIANLTAERQGDSLELSLAYARS